MKNFSCILILICICHVVQAQSNTSPEFAPTGAKWTVLNVEGYPVNAYTSSYFSSGDTIIENRNCRKIGANDIAFYAYRDSLKIYFHSVDTGQHWKLLYNFGWQVNDTVIVPATISNGNNVHLANDSLYFFVKTKGDTMINGYTLPFIVLSDGGHDYPIVMNIGCTVSHFIIFKQLTQDAFSVGFRCYEDTVIGTYKSEYVTGNCDTAYNTGILHNELQKTDVAISPNPTQDYLHVNMNAQCNNVHIILTDIAGHVVLQKPIADKETIDIGLLAPGIYFYQVMLGKTKLRPGRIVKL